MNGHFNFQVQPITFRGVNDPPILPPKTQRLKPGAGVLRKQRPKSSIPGGRRVTKIDISKRD